MGRRFRLERIATGRVARYGYLFLLFFYVPGLFVLFLRGSLAVKPNGSFNMVDFGCFWSGAIATLTGNASEVYNYSYFSDLQVSLFGAQVAAGQAFHWLYPPTFLIYIIPLGTLPFLAAYVVWILSTFSLSLVGLRKTTQKPLTVLLAVAPGPVLWTVRLGQTGFLAVGLMSLSLAVIEKRPLVGGMILGLLSYKPQLGILFPIVLVSTGHWRAVLGAGFSCIALGTATTWLFGVGIWTEFLQSIAYADPRLMPARNILPNLQTAYGLAIWAGASVVSARTTAIIVGLGTTLLTCLIWRRPVSNSLKAAAISSGALIATPYLLPYDLTILAVPVTFLLKEVRSTGVSIGECVILSFGWLLLFAMVMPVGPIVNILLFGLICHRAFFAGSGGVALPNKIECDRPERVGGNPWSENEGHTGD
jgi:hypothetical protein